MYQSLKHSTDAHNFVIFIAIKLLHEVVHIINTCANPLLLSGSDGACARTPERIINDFKYKYSDPGEMIEVLLFGGEVWHFSNDPSMHITLARFFVVTNPTSGCGFSACFCFSSHVRHHCIVAPTTAR